MQIVVGHANPDFDAYASTIAALKLFPGSCGVFLGSQNANVRAFHNLHEGLFDFVDLKGLDLDSIDSVVMVDTRDPDRIGELGPVVRRPGVRVIVYDHHPPQEGDIVGVDDRSGIAGATASLMVSEIMRRGLEVTPLEASVMLLGIHEDTGSLTYPSTTPLDAVAVAWLMENGADIEVLNQFLQRSLSPAQRAILDGLVSSLQVWNLHGTPIAIGTAEADEYVDSAGVLTHFVVEDMGFRVAIAIVHMPQRVQVLARSRVAEVDVGAVMARLGGGGHPQAASAGFREISPEEALARVREALEAEIKPAMVARELMSSPVRTVESSASMEDAGLLMARWGHGGVPVLDHGRLAGIVTRKDVDKAIAHKLGHAPVKGFMAHKLITVPPTASVAELEALLARRGIGRLPVVDESGKLIGIVTRKDVLRAEHGEAYIATPGVSSVSALADAERCFAASVEALLPPKASEVLATLGKIAAERGVHAHLVGGFVRDMLLRRRNLDIDVVVEGDGVAFAEEVARRSGGATLKVHRRFGTASIGFGNGFHIDVASARAEYYTHPGALPTVERSSLRQDLLRRDFSINAMAVSLDPSLRCTITDPFGGLRDLETGTIRVLHTLSFVDDPTRVIRAARFEGRFGFQMDESTERLAREAVSMGLLREISGARLREEFYDVLAEENHLAMLQRLADLGALGDLLPKTGKPAEEALACATEALRALDHLGDLFRRPPHTLGVLLSALTWGSERAAVEAWVRHIRVRAPLAAAPLALAERGQVVLRGLQDRRRMHDSRLFHLLDPMPPEAAVVLYAIGSAAARRRIEHFLRDVRDIRPAVTGEDLLALGAKPSGAFSAILARARDDRLDGRAVGREAELANLRRLAVREGLIAP